MTARAFRVTGRVQGVGFRWSAQEEARRQGLAGWVQNDDGAVSGLVQGPDEGLEAFRTWLGRGPRGARVDSVRWDEAGPTGLRIFVIRERGYPPNDS